MEYSNINGGVGVVVVGLLLLQYHIKQIRGDVKVRREVGKSVFTWLYPHYMEAGFIVS